MISVVVGRALFAPSLIWAKVVAEPALISVEPVYVLWLLSVKSPVPPELGRKALVPILTSLLPEITALRPNTMPVPVTPEKLGPIAVTKLPGVKSSALTKAALAEFRTTGTLITPTPAPAVVL